MSQFRGLLSFFIAGFVFAIGLAFSGMTQPLKVIGFLDLAGNWDISLMMVMLAAIPIHFIAYQVKNKMQSPVCDSHFHVPNTREITKPLIVGALIFGAGWGLGGFCPGPALASLVTGRAEVFVFVGMMILGMILQKRVSWKFLGL